MVVYTVDEGLGAGEDAGGPRVGGVDVDEGADATKGIWKGM